MAIILRNNKGSELTHAEMDTNLGSFYYSSSLAGGNLTLFTTGSVSHSIALTGTAGAQGAQGAASNVAGPQGAPGNNGNNGAQGAEGAQGAPSNVAGPQGAQGAGGTPSGSNTHIQFNRLGNFGGDAGLTYASASQILTVDKSTAPTAASPNILLLGNSSTAGALSGVVAGSATAANTTPASIQFKNAVTHGLGDFGTDVLIKTAFSDGLGTTVERTAATFTASGDTHFGYDIFAPNLDNTVQDNVVGFNSTTGEFTYFSTSSLVNLAPSTFITSSVYSGGGQIVFSPTSSYNVYSINNINDSNVSITLTKNAALPVGSPITLAVNFTASNIDPLCTLTIRYDKGASNVDLLFNSGITANYVATFIAHDFNGGGFVNNGFIQTS